MLLPAINGSIRTAENPLKTGKRLFKQKELLLGAIHSAHYSYGYTLKEIGDFLGLHYTTISRVTKALKNKQTSF